jgi:ATP phosphoribosyltransferase regulatory subunit
VAALGGERSELLCALLEAAGKADDALDALGRMDLPRTAAAERERLRQVIALIRAEAPEVVLTVDPVENRGFEYHTGISFTIFAPGVRGELGSGGRYVAVNGTIGSAGLRGEPATGFTLYVDTILGVLPAAANGRCVFVPIGTMPVASRQLREAGWTTIAGLAEVADVVVEARRLDCSHVYLEGRVVPLGAD